jgi:protease-4
MSRILLSLLIVLLVLVAMSVAIVALMDAGGGGKVALVYVRGPIVDVRDKVKELKEYAEDDSIKAIVLRVESPGGAVAPSQELYSEVRRINEIKAVVASMGTVAASGGYYISAPAEMIMANPGTLTGSIGVIMEIPNVEGLMDKVGLKTEVIKSGKHKDMASSLRKMSQDDRKLLQEIIEDVYMQFVKDVAVSREMDLELVKELADGRIYTGNQAMGSGLVDEIGGLEDAIRRTAEIAGIEGEPRVVTKKEKMSIWDSIEGRISGSMRDVFPYIKLSYIINP